MCPLCGAEERLGVWLTRTEVLVFDAVKRAGEGGAAWEDIAEVVGSARDNRCSRDNIKIHVHHIREKLVETDWTIRGVRGAPSLFSGYRLQKQEGPCRSTKSRSPIRSATAR